jgi:hypothetical protein
MNHLDWNQTPAEAFVGIRMTGRPLAIANHLRGLS